MSSAISLSISATSAANFFLFSIDSPMISRTFSHLGGPGATSGPSSFPPLPLVLFGLLSSFLGAVLSPTCTSLRDVSLSVTDFSLPRFLGKCALSLGI